MLEVTWPCTITIWPITRNLKKHIVKNFDDYGNEIEQIR